MVQRLPKFDDNDLLVRLDSVDVPLLPSEPGRKQIEHEDQEFGNGCFGCDKISMVTWG